MQLFERWCRWFRGGADTSSVEIVRMTDSEFIIYIGIIFHEYQNAHINFNGPAAVGTPNRHVPLLDVQTSMLDVSRRGQGDPKISWTSRKHE